METKSYTVYKFNELTDEQKDKAIENLADINIDYEWWDYIDDDGQIKLREFDLDRGAYCKIEFIESAEATAQYIVENHGDMCDTYKTSKQFLKERAKLQKTLARLEKEFVPLSGNVKKEIEAMEKVEFDIGILNELYNTDLSNDYLALLRRDYEYRTGREAIIETIEANEYDFTSDGKID